MNLCLITAGMSPARWRLQPWRYLLETARLLRRMGQAVIIISNCEAGRPEADEVEGVPIQRVPELRPLWRWPNPLLDQAIARHQPDVLIWHVGLTSFLHFDLTDRFTAPSIGIFTSPVYSFAEVLRPGLIHLLAERELSAMHGLGLLVPSAAIRRQLGPGKLRRLVTLSHTARQALVQRGIAPADITTIRPGLDPEWLEPVTQQEAEAVRGQMGFSPGDVVAAYAGPPVRLRGLDTLVSAVAEARRSAPHQKLLILSRRHAHEHARAEDRVKGLIARLGLEPAVRWVSGFLDAATFRRHLAAADIIALPFELVPSDMPLSVLEAQALGKRVLTTRMACLPEMMPEDSPLVAPGDVAGLARALDDLAAGPARCADIGRAARQFAGRWGNWDERYSQWEQLLHGL
jgi:glycosyltransferase involved in cell wall biosynthesis